MQGGCMQKTLVTSHQPIEEMSVFCAIYRKTFMILMYVKLELLGFCINTSLQ